MKNAGWLKLYRDIKDWKYFDNLKHLKVWIQMLLEANYDQSIFEGEVIDRGELVFTYRTWVKKFRDCNPKISKANLETIIRNFKLSGQIKVRKTIEKRISIIKIVNFDAYQSVDLNPNLGQKIETVTHRKSRQRGAKIETPTQTVEKPKQSTETSLCKEEQLDMFLSQDINPDGNQDTLGQNQDSNAPKIETTKRNKKKNIRNKEEYICKKFSKKFLILAEKIINAMNEKMDTIGYKKFDLYNEEEVLSQINIVYKQGNKEIEDYLKIINYKFMDWSEQVNKNGKPMMSYFTPTTLFKRHFDKYLREAENFAIQGRLKAPEDRIKEEEQARYLKEKKIDEEIKADLEREKQEKQRKIEMEKQKKLDLMLKKLREKNKSIEDGKVLSLT